MSQHVMPIDPPSEGRHQSRTHFFVAATLYAGAGSTAVTIRNMSQCGALIEGTALPGVGEQIRLKRGHLEATGWVAWRAGRKAGIRLEAAVYVSDWMSRQGSVGQERVDALVSIVRNDDCDPAAVPRRASGTLSLEAELRQLRQELTALEAALLKDVILVATHPEIQTLDISVQRIDRILKAHCGRG